MRHNLRFESQNPTRNIRRIVLSVSLACLLCLMAACGSKPVATVATESEADEILDVLRDNGFDVEKKEVGEEDVKRWRVEVDEGLFGGGDASLAIQVLRDNGLPRPTDKGLEGAYEEKGMFPSESAQQAQRLKELKTEIERQLRVLPGVTRVSANIVLPESNTLSLQPYPATASVLIVHKDAKPNFTAEQVQNLVARGVPNLKPENVSVSMAQQPPRPIPRRDMDVRRRNNIIFAIGTGVLMVLGVLLVVLILQTRRQRAQLTELREGLEVEAEEGDEAETAPVEGDGQRRLAGEAAQTDSSARQLSSAFAEQLSAGSSKALQSGETKPKAVNE